MYKYQENVQCFIIYKYFEQKKKEIHEIKIILMIRKKI